MPLPAVILKYWNNVSREDAVEAIFPPLSLRARKSVIHDSVSLNFFSPHQRNVRPCHVCHYRAILNFDRFDPP